MEKQEENEGKGEGEGEGQAEYGAKKVKQSKSERDEEG